MSTVLRNCFQGPCRHLDGDKFFQLGNPDPLGLEIRREIARCHCCDMHTDAPLLFGETSTVNFGSANWTGTGDGALSGHK